LLGGGWNKDLDGGDPLQVDGEREGEEGKEGKEGKGKGRRGEGEEGKKRVGKKE